MTINEALRLGKKKIRYTVNVFFLSCLLLTFVMAYSYDYGAVFVLIGVLGSFVGGTMIYNYQVATWIIETYAQVSNITELKRRAVIERLVWPDDSFYAKTMIFTAGQKSRIAELERIKSNNREIEILIDDGSIPAKTEIRYSLWLPIAYGLFGVSSIVIAIWTAINVQSLVALLWAAIAIYFGYKFFDKGIDRSIILAIDSKGVTSPELGFTSWDRIREIDSFTHGHGKRMTVDLWISTSSKSETLDFGLLEMKRHDIEDRIAIYRQRNKKLTTTTGNTP